MTELRVSHNDQMLVFQGIDTSTCLQPIIGKPALMSETSANIRKQADNALSHYPLHIVIHKSLANRAQTATGFLGQKHHDPNHQNDFLTNSILVGHKFASKRLNDSTEDYMSSEKTDQGKYFKDGINRGKSAPGFPRNNKTLKNLPFDSFVITPVFKMKLETKSILYIRKENTFLNMKPVQSPDMSVLNDYFPTDFRLCNHKSLSKKYEDSLKSCLSPATLFKDAKNIEHNSSSKKKYISRMNFQNGHLLPLLWSEDLRESSLFGYTKGKVPFNAVLAANKYVSS